MFSVFINKTQKQLEQQLEQQLLTDTSALAMPHGRRVGKPGHDVAREYLLGRLTDLGLKPFKGGCFELPYIGEHYKTKNEQLFTNLVGVIPGTKKNLPPLLLGAHYDSVIDAPCADDNATSVAFTLAIAEMVKKKPLKRDLIIALFDAEEPPYFLGQYMGSTRFYEDHCEGINFAGVIITDLIGHDFELPEELGLPSWTKPILPETKDFLFMTGAESDSVFPLIVKSLSQKHTNLKIFPTLNSYIGSMSDHHIFEQNGQPFLFFSCAQGKYYHHELDNLDWINFEKLARITNFVADIIFKLDILPAGEKLYSEDPVEFELEMIKKAVGSIKYNLAFRALEAKFDIKEPKSRKDLDTLIHGIIDGAIDIR